MAGQHSPLDAGVVEHFEHVEREAARLDVLGPEVARAQPWHARQSRLAVATRVGVHGAIPGLDDTRADADPVRVAARPAVDEQNGRAAAVADHRVHDARAIGREDLAVLRKYRVVTRPLTLRVHAGNRMYSSMMS